MLKAKGRQHAEADAVMAEVGGLKAELEASATRLEQIQAEMQALLLAVPNLPHESVPVGADETRQCGGAQLGHDRSKRLTLT